MQRCPRVTVLVTSREPLRIEGEVAYRVPSLSLPGPDSSLSAQSLLGFESVALFCERVRFHRPHFALAHPNAAAVASICSRLDGIALAIELAAARVRAMPIEELDQRLKRGFNVLARERSTAPRRQQTLRATIDWSYDLLSEAEQLLLGRLSIFRGGCTLSAAEHVCADATVATESVIDLLTSLADKSLVTVEERSGEARYRLLEPVRQYASERLADRGDDACWRDRHLAHFVALAEEVEPLLKGAEVEIGLERLSAEHDNLRLAMDRAEREDALAGLRIAAAMWWFWAVRGHLLEGRQRLSRLLGGVPDFEPLPLRATALRGAGALAREQGDYDAAEALHGQSLAIRRALGDRRGIALALGSLATVATERGDHETAAPLYEESLAIQRELGDRASVAMLLTNLGELNVYRRHFPVARAELDEALSIYRELGNRWGVAASLTMLGRLAACERELPKALALLEEALAIRRDIGHAPGIAWTLADLASVAFAVGDACHAAKLWGSAERLREDIDAPLSPSGRAMFERQVDAARATTDQHAFESAWQEGRAMKLDHAIDYALSSETYAIDKAGDALDVRAAPM